MADGHHLAGLLSAYADDEDEEEMEEQAQAGRTPDDDQDTDKNGAWDERSKAGPDATGRAQGAVGRHESKATDSRGLQSLQDGSPSEKKLTEDAKARKSLEAPGARPGGTGESEAETRAEQSSQAPLLTSGPSALGIFGDYGGDAGEDEDEDQDMEQGEEAMAGVKRDSAKGPGGQRSTPGRAILTPPTGSNRTPQQGTPGTTPGQTGRQTPPSGVPSGDGAGRVDVPKASVEPGLEMKENGATVDDRREGDAWSRENGAATSADAQGARGDGRDSGADGAQDDAVLEFLGPPVTEACPPELQAKFRMYLERKKQGLSLNDSIRRSKNYRNPYLMQQIVESKGIEEHSSFFPREIFDPKGYPERDFYDSLIIEQRREAERREAERKAKGAQAQVEFHRGGVLLQQSQGQAGLSAANKPLVQVISGPKPTAQAATGPVVATGKKSKWDKGAPGGTQQTTPPGAAVLQQQQGLLANQALLGLTGAASGALQGLGGAAAAGASGIGRGAHLAAAAARAAAITAAAAAAAANAGVSSSSQSFAGP